MATKRDIVLVSAALRAGFESAAVGINGEIRRIPVDIDSFLKGFEPSLEEERKEFEHWFYNQNVVSKNFDYSAAWESWKAARGIEE